tara:strand:- start:5014 stop:5832 length:819 start_codon:yes stop_codon:yes gene_type:complete
MTSEIKVNTIKKNSGSTITIGEGGDTVTITPGITAASLTSGTVPTARLSAVPNSSLANSAITINGSGVSLGGSVTIGETKPTISSISPSVITNDATNIVISGSNYVSVPQVEAINSTGAITAANSVAFTSASSITANFTLPTDGTYFIRIENNDGNAVRSGSALLTVSDVPAWTTAAGSLGQVGAAGSISFTVAATDATSYSIVSGALPGGGSLNTSTGAITGTESGSTQTTTYNFTIRATDAQGQTADRAFAITIVHGIQNAMGFDNYGTF